MHIQNAILSGPEKWNGFVSRHYPPVGGFMQAWEWGMFQEKLGRSVERYFVLDGTEPVAAFTLIYHPLPFGLRYAYAARGPVLAVSDQRAQAEIFHTIRDWIGKYAPDLIFLRLEPPIQNLPEDLRPPAFRIPDYYLQPRYNLVVPLSGSTEDILRSFHPSTRSNMARAEKRGASVDVSDSIEESDYEQFRQMMRDTIARNSGVNAYPRREYFDALFAVLSPGSSAAQKSRMSLGVFRGQVSGEPACTHFVLYFGDTATYLYGASFTKHLNAKIPSYVHWSAILEAKRRGMLYYDLGGIDPGRWPKLTEYKRQFRGEEVEYFGNLDIPLKPWGYRLYNILRRLKK